MRAYTWGFETGTSLLIGNLLKRYALLHVDSQRASAVIPQPASWTNQSGKVGRPHQATEPHAHVGLGPAILKATRMIFKGPAFDLTEKDEGMGCEVAR